MHRRSLLMALGALPVAGLRAEHGWSTYDLTRPLYLEGPVVLIIWADPHPYLEMLHRGDAQVPRDLRQRPIPRQQATVDMADLLGRVVVPPAQAGRRWRVNLPTLARLSRWGLPRPKVEQVIGVVGHPGPLTTGTATVQAEILYIDGRAYPMRSDPA